MRCLAGKYKAKCLLMDQTESNSKSGPLLHHLCRNIVRQGTLGHLTSEEDDESNYSIPCSDECAIQLVWAVEAIFSIAR